MKQLETSGAARVFYYFEELCKIPHGSGNTKEISDYCAEFAKEHGLFYVQDEKNNIIIKKKAAPGYENQQTIILQGHLDMVCECEPGTTFDFVNNGLELYIEEDYISAKNTTLGADDGIAVAIALALLEAEDIPHPAIEAVFTVDEEIGLLGAASIDVSPLEGKWMLNLDSEVEGSFLAGCAGGMRVNASVPIARSEAGGCGIQLTVTGLQGGHSGIEIQCERGNAINLAGRVLGQLADAYPVKLYQLEGGLMDNAIPRESVIGMIVAERDVEAICEMTAKIEQILKKEYQSSDPELMIRVQKLGDIKEKVLTDGALKKILAFFDALPRGVQNMCADLQNLVETSLNAGIMCLEERALKIAFSIRSSVESRRDELAGRIHRVAKYLGGTCQDTGVYPAWEYAPESELRSRIVNCYESMYGKKPVIEVIHAGLECGLFAGKIPELQCVSFGPDILDIHTPKERLSISSTERCWDFVCEFLKEGCK